MREPVVSRTVKVTKAEAVCVDSSTQSIVIREFELIRATDEKKVLKVAKEKFETETIKVSYVKILDTTPIVYVMPEKEFLQYAKPIDNKKMKRRV